AGGGTFGDGTCHFHDFSENLYWGNGDETSSVFNVQDNYNWNSIEDMPQKWFYVESQFVDAQQHLRGNNDTNYVNSLNAAPDVLLTPNPCQFAGGGAPGACGTHDAYLSTGQQYGYVFGIGGDCTGACRSMVVRGLYQLSECDNDDVLNSVHACTARYVGINQ